MYHVRQLDDTGFTVSQMTINFPTIKAAREAAVKAEKKTGDVYTVCESLEHTDKRNVKGVGRFGFLPIDADAVDGAEEVVEEKPKAKAKPRK